MAIGGGVGKVAYGPPSGEGGAFRLRPGLPPRDQLEYVQALATVLLLLMALGLFTYYLATAPRKALSMALSRVGMRP